MKSSVLGQDELRALESAFGEQLQRQVPLARFTSSRIGGPADYLLPVRSKDELAEAAEALWRIGVPYRVLGGGSNALVADAGYRGVIVLNQARAVRFLDEGESGVWAESGASFGSLGRRAVARGLGGLTWAATVPGTVGGAVVGNAGAHGGDTAGCLKLAEILQQGEGVQQWTPERLQFGYRTSWLKEHPGQTVVLNATFSLTPADPNQLATEMETYVEHRRTTQPPGASWGSMFKNPPGDHAGRLIEATGLKGLRRGGAEVSQLHANFFVNTGEATAADAWALLTEVRRRVEERHGVVLELEIECLGQWDDPTTTGADG